MAHICLQRLIDLGVASPNLILVSPTSNSTKVFKDKNIEDKMASILAQQLGINTYHNYKVEKFEFDDDNGGLEDEEDGNNNLSNNNNSSDGWKKITGIYLQNMTPSSKRSKLTEIPTCCFIYCHIKDVEDTIIKQINQKSLVFDGSLVVNHKFCTIDEAIYAAGPLAKFSRRYGPTEAFEMYNSREVGEKLAIQVLRNFGVERFLDVTSQSLEKNENTKSKANRRDSFISRSMDNVKYNWKNLPKFTKPLSIRCILPSDFRYFHAQLPGWDPNRKEVRNLLLSFF